MSLYKKSNQPGQVAQCKTPVSAQSSKRPVAPPVYRPQSVPKVLQKKSSPVQHPLAAQARRIVQPKPMSHGPKSPAVPPVYRPKQPQAGPPRPVPSRSQAVQRSLLGEPSDITNEITSYLDTQSLSRLSRTDKVFSEQLAGPLFVKLLVPGNYEKKYRVHKDNYEYVCKYMEEKCGSGEAFLLRNRIKNVMCARPDVDPSDTFWGHVHSFLSVPEIHELLKDPKFGESFATPWSLSQDIKLLLGGAALALGAGAALYNFFKKRRL